MAIYFFTGKFVFLLSRNYSVKDIVYMTVQFSYCINYS